MEYIVSVLLGILGNLLTPTAKRLLRWPAEPDEPTRLPIPIIKGHVTNDEKEAIREYNRQRLEQVGRLVWIHSITFLFLFSAFFLPLLWRTMPGKDVDLAETRLPTFGADIALDHQHIGLLSLGFTLLLYVPVWLLSQPVGHFFATVLDQIHQVTPTRYASLIALSFVGLSFLVAGHWVFVLFPQNSYLSSVALPFVAVGVVGFFSSARR